MTPFASKDDASSEVSIIYDENTDDNDINEYDENDLLERTLDNAYDTYVGNAGSSDNILKRNEWDDMIKDGRIVLEPTVNAILSQTNKSELTNNGITANQAGKAKGLRLIMSSENLDTKKPYNYTIVAKPKAGYTLESYDIFNHCKLNDVADNSFVTLNGDNLANNETPEAKSSDDNIYVIHSIVADPGVNVYYDGNGASSGTVDAQLNKTPNVPFNLQTNNFTKNASDGAEFVIRNGNTIEKTFNPTGTFTYLGWDSNAKAKTPLYSQNQSVSFDAGTYNLFAIWDDLKISYIDVADKYYVKVKYDANGGTVINGAVKYDEATHEREFLGWGYYNDDAVVYPVSTKSDITLKGNEFNAIDAKFADVSVTIEDANDLERNGYSFIGWSEDKNATAASVGIIYPNEVKKLQKDTTYYAVWVKDGDSFNIAYKKHIDRVSGTKADDTNLYDGARIGVNDAFSLAYNIRYLVDVPIKETDFIDNQTVNATFLGWSLTKNNQVGFLENQKVTASGLGINYGQTANVYTVFDEVTITLPKITHTGSKILTGWKDVDTKTVYPVGDTVTVTDDMTFTPVWNDSTDDTKYTVIFDGNNPTKGSMDNQEIEIDALTPLDKNAYEKTFTVTFDYNDGTDTKQVETVDASFVDWTNTEDTSKHYEDEEAVFNLTEGGKSIRLLAGWDADVTPPKVSGIKGWAYVKTSDVPDYPSVNGETAPIKINKNITLYAIYDKDNKAKVTVKYFFEHDDGSISIRDDLTKVFEEVINKKIDIIPEDFDDYITPPTVSIFVSEDESRNEVKLIYHKDRADDEHSYKIIYYLEQDDGSFVKFDEETGKAEIGTIISSKKEIAGYIKPTNTITVTADDAENVLECYYRKIKSPSEDIDNPNPTPTPDDDTDKTDGHKFTVNYYKVSSNKKNPVLVAFEQGYADVGDVIKADPDRYPGYKLISGESMVIVEDDTQNILNAVYMYEGGKSSSSSSGGSSSGSSSGGSGGSTGGGSSVSTPAGTYTQASNVIGSSQTSSYNGDGKIASNAKTGDESKLLFYIFGLFGVMALGFVFIRRKKLNKKD